VASPCVALGILNNLFVYLIIFFDLLIYTAVGDLIYIFQNLCALAGRHLTKLRI